MNFDSQLTAPCIIPESPVVDPRCSDQDFALAHPILCANQTVLLIKPETALICRLGSISFRVFEYRTGVETEVLDNITFTSSDNNVFAIGVHSGSGTGLAEGVVTITATRNGLSATADVTVLAENTCCDDTNVASSILIDNSRSMSLQFGGAYGTRLVFAKAAALLYGNPILLANGLPKDKIKVWSFNDAPTQISADFIQVDATVASQIAGVQQSLNKTDLLEALTSAVDDMLNATADEKILVLVSDGEETTLTNRQAILDYGALFKAAGGIIIVVAPRASGAGYDLLERLATGGFFLNAISTNAADVLDELSYLKSILCVGRCVSAGDEYVPTPQLNFSSFSNWEVTQGQVNLIGNGLLDIQPDNGLYVDLNGGTAGVMRTIDTFDLVSGRTYRIAFDVAGNNRLDSAGANQALKAYLRDINANDSDPNIFDHAVSPAWDSPFATYSFTFVAPYNVTVRLYFEQLVSSGFSGTWHGNLLDDVVLDDVTSQITLLSDDFNQENLQYVPPNCGEGSFPIVIPVDSVPNEISGDLSGLLWKIPCTAQVNEIQCNCANPDPSDQSIVISADSQALFDINIRIRGVVELNEYVGGSVLPNTDNRCELDGESIGSSLNIYSLIISDPPATYRLNAGTNAETLAQTSAGAVDYDFTFQARTGATVILRSDSQFFSEFRNGANAVVDGAGLDPSITQPYDGQFLQMDVLSVTAIGDIENGTGIGYDYYDNYCYTECNSSTPGTQSVDPSPLPDIESNYTPPITFTSTKTVCATCDPGFVNVSTTNLVPAMTSNTAPSGTASASDNSTEAWKAFDGVATYSPFSGWESVATPAWLRYQFVAAKTVAAYAITAWKQAGSPRAWTFEGSLTGATWVELDSQTGITWFPGERKMFLAPNVTAYSYYRLNVSDSPPDSEGGDSTVISELELYEAAPGQVCSTATEISYVSQGAADAAATAAALAAAQAQLSCVEQFTSTASHTSVCPDFQYGVPVTRSATRTSLVSQAEADSAAEAEATELADAARNCSQSNNTEQIAINDRTGSEPAKATPYISAKYVSGYAPGDQITAVEIHLNGFSAGSPDDVRMLLRSPLGTAVAFLENAGGTFVVSNLNLVFRDDAASALPDATALTSGTWKVSRYGSPLQFPQPAPTLPYSSLLSAFNGENPNGTWVLQIIDDSAVDSGLVSNGWDIVISI